MEYVHISSCNLLYDFNFLWSSTYTINDIEYTYNIMTIIIIVITKLDTHVDIILNKQSLLWFC